MTRSSPLQGVAAFDALHEQMFTLRAFLIRIFGDMPAMAKLMRMKGLNTIYPCRACHIRGICDTEGGRTNYFIRQAVHIDTAPSDAEAERRSKNTGINGLPILATLSSLSFPGSFGHDLMHLIPENVVKNLLALWTTNFKGLETTNEKYRLQPAVIDAIGAACVTAGDTTPAAFRVRVPNIATQLHYFTAKSYTLWTTLLGSVVLRNQFQQRKYYTHFIELVRIFNDCLALSISREYVDTELRARIANWVLDFEDYLVRSSKSRQNPYASARRLREIAQNSVIKMKYNLHRELDLSDRCDDELKAEGFSNYPDICVLHPHTKGPLDRLAYKAVRNYLLRTVDVSEAAVDTAIPGSVSSWGRISFLNGADLIRSVELVHASENYMSRDASCIKVFIHICSLIHLLTVLEYSHDVDKIEIVADSPSYLNAA
ncbi:hypothetical protein DFH08DRAFT_971461 [Mycena albidolilacea]|uniref:Uncharacterized protein n=1 Tax=Mycena albidolilacea TaxID=1033008 RepID=A0AAD7EEJ3_9AGAR|nr:hypothetical protein DFH08DRAFT_971461 [Mycena albidolilacea]